MASEKRTAAEKAEIVRTICERMAEGKSLRQATMNNDPVSKSTFLRWCDGNKKIADQYARALEARTDVLADEILDISDDSSKDTLHGEFGPYENKEWVNRSKLRVESRKWLLSKMMPRRYGDKMDVTTNGKDIPTAPPVFNSYGGSPPMASSEDEIDEEREEI